jgi:hypothetical protein
MAMPTTTKYAANRNFDAAMKWVAVNYAELQAMATAIDLEPASCFCVVRTAIATAGATYGASRSPTTGTVVRPWSAHPVRHGSLFQSRPLSCW